ncbi:MAG TPA: c-type cytochrome [Acidobacteriota bacterium]|nr:c-type cytochrome [Acidobacteriota bacterium]
MKRQGKKGRLLGLLLLLAVIGAGLLLIIFRAEIFPESSPAQRGARLMETAGCWSCHSAESGAFNPDRGKHPAEYSTVHSLFRERLSLAEMRQWIAQGLSEARANSQAYMASREREALKMPAYKNHLSVAEIDEIIAYLALEQYRHDVKQSLRQGDAHDLPRGELLAHRMACYSCHGVLGQGGTGNLDSLKSYIPGFFGSDFDALTAGERSQVLEWIRDGASQAFLDQSFLGFHPGRYFRDSQAIGMPAYKDYLSEQDLEELADHVLELRSWGPLNARDFFQKRPLKAPQRDEDDEASPVAGSERNSEGDSALFDQVRPILTRCVKCHGPSEHKSEYRMDTREHLLAGGEIAEFMERSTAVAGDPGASMIITFVEAAEEDPYNEIYPMPPEGDRLTTQEIELLRRWIREGLPWPSGEELLPPENEN